MQIDIFAFYGVARYMFFDGSSGIMILKNSFYLIDHMVMKAFVAHIGCTTTQTAERIKVTIVKMINELSYFETSRFTLRQMLLEFQMRNLKLQNNFFVVDWTVFIAVSKIN